MVSNLLFLSSTNHVQTLRHVQSHLQHFYTSFTLFSDSIMANLHVCNDRCGNNVVHVEGRQFRLHTVQIWRRRVQSDKKRIPVIITTEHLVNFTKLGLRFHQNASLIKKMLIVIVKHQSCFSFSNRIWRLCFKNGEKKVNERKEKEQ